MRTTSSSYSSASQSISLACLVALALTLVTFSANPVVATASHSASKTSGTLQPTSLVDALASHAYGSSAAQASEKQESDKKKYSSMAKGGAFAGLGAFSNLPEKPLWGLETDKHKVQKSKKEQASRSSKTHSSSKPSPTSVTSNTNAYMQENASRDLDGSLSLELDKLLGPAFSGALDMSGGIGLDFSSSSGQPSRTTSSAYAMSTSSHSKSSRTGQPAKSATHASGSSSNGNKSAHTKHAGHASESQGNSEHDSSTGNHGKSTHSNSKHASSTGSHSQPTHSNPKHASTTTSHSHPTQSESAHASSTHSKSKYDSCTETDAKSTQSNSKHASSTRSHAKPTQSKAGHSSTTMSHSKASQSESAHSSTATSHAKSSQSKSAHTSTTTSHAHTSSAAQPPQANIRTDGLRSNGFYRIGLTEDSKPVLIQPAEANNQSTSDNPRVATVGSANEPGGNLPNQSVITNNPDYGFLDAQDDLYAIRKWAGDMGRLVSKENRNETLIALFSAASRYYPDVDTKVVVRIMLADIKAESDFEASNESSGRLDSGSSIGLLQVSPYGSSDELKQFQTASTFHRNVYSWCVGNGTDVEVQYGGASVLGPLRSFETGEVLKASSLTTADLNKPWINIHIAMWLQTNHARTGSQDPSLWPKVSSSSKNVRAAYQPALLEILTGSKDATSSSSSNTSTPYSATTYTSKLNALHKRLIGTNAQSTTFATGLGSWVAGPSDDSGGYNTSGDDVSTQYLKNIGKGLSVLYTGSTKEWQTYGKNWLDTIQLTPGLIDYAK
ncbi:hypothetical protein MYAM1_003839 [Malassezia yamatoensis]|uniref:Transglycosylase SLT domain-containing protein n=1 Tax=Malassezia yamatoensis TaxID=253288 RepID=A0AAJ5Z0P8_9BASI|nr:hypothetical protein MYAM1_003839 [Malassezia yamatoensis]